ncbi:AMP-binding protein [Parvibaculum sedimenti]|uniref:AMP-binding protein n=1 Tax=Parvibaculum sedimenti TaxID=2608632 RepID=A0A6N6VLL1_9HYPH|nr:AMP-binding protein [Parvibaculum sedimenti]KAB7741652.1 AMP-binding protein [Parvibaculum sedimenti]
MHPYIHAQKTPSKPAYIMASTGETVTFKELDERSNQLAHLFRAAGLKAGDAIAIFMDNNVRYFEICWAAQRAGLYFTCVPSRLTASEVAYIVGDCGARLLFVSKALEPVAAQLVAEKLVPKVERCFAIGGDIPGYETYEEARNAFPTTPIADQSAGTDMLYSSGTTGRPKGVKHPLTGGAIDEETGLTGLAQLLYGFDENTIYLSPAPLYHAAPLRWCMTAQRLGGTVIVMEHFDAEEALKLIEKYKVTHSQWVPTMFVRMLKMPEDVRKKYDVSSLKVAIHAAAPCPVPVKQQMIDWWGPVIFEYYAGSEGNGFCALDSKEWLSHRGSVGKALNAIVHICDDEGNELPVGEAGTIYFESATQFEYHNDPKKTAESRHSKGWSTLGDIGRLDEEGYVYLTDRKAFMIISGGVNIYPQEAENTLVLHPKVADVAVIGVPNEDFGEEVKAVVQPVDWTDAGPALEAELLEFCKQHLSPIKCPRSIDFEEQLPRHPTGKLYKRLIRDRYWGNKESKIV